MNLSKVTVHGFKRFKEKQFMYVDSKLVSIIGANEAGKSSFLNLLTHWNHTEEFQYLELSRKASIPDDQDIIKCFFRLDSSDRGALSHIPEALRISSFSMAKEKSGGRYYSLEPKIKRDIYLRGRLFEKLDKAQNNKTKKFIRRFEEVKSQFDDEEGIQVDIDEIREILQSEEQTIEDSDINQLEQAMRVIDELVGSKDPKYFQELPALFEKVIQKEYREEPAKEVSNILLHRLPTFLLFGEKERSLKSTYNLQDEDDLEDLALNNLASTAQLSLLELKLAIDNGDEAEIERLKEIANEKLKSEFKTWKQDEVYPVIKLDDSRVTILFGNRDKGGYDDIAERSDGLRQFTALFTFIKSNFSTEDVPKILLIDEAETHLHYDAQADFIQMLAKQDLVQKVIYTTHSIGCLPEDLGAGVRLIRQDKEEDEKDNTSSIVNWFWGNKRPGYSSILFGMGASTLAFIPLRHALFSEGAIDYILLPTLLKESINKDHLDFQVVPKISEASVQQLNIMDQESPKTAYLIDSDHGKSKLQSRLKKAGIDDKQVFLLPERKGVGLSIEDIIDKAVYLDAVNSVLRDNNDDGFSLTIKNIPDNDRAKAVDNLCKGHKKPRKRDIAYRLLEIKVEGRKLLSKDVKSDLAELVEQIKTIFE